MRICVLGIVAASLVVSPSISGQAPPAQERPVIKVTLDEWASVPGRLAMYRRTATPDGDRLLVEGLDMLTPVIVAVQSDDPTRVIHLALFKEGIKAPVRSADTNAQGSAGMDFRTYGDVGIDLRADTPTPYLLTVWTAPPREVSVPSPFVVGRDAWRPVWLWSAGGAAATLALVALAMVLWSRKRSALRAAGTGAAIVAILALGTSVSAGPDDNAKNFGDKLLNQGIKIDSNGKMFPQTQGIQPGKPNPPMKAPDFGRAKDLWNFFHAVSGVAKYNGLGPDDNSYEPQLAPDGMPKVRVSCAESGACGQCFAHAYGDLTDVRKKLENNRIVLLHFHRRIQNINTTAQAVAGLGMTAGFLYQQEKAKWDAEVAAVEGSYDGHYTTLMDDLKKALRAIEQCEAEHNGYADWYNRSGFMYYEFMAAHYHR